MSNPERYFHKARVLYLLQFFYFQHACKRPPLPHLSYRCTRRKAAMSQGCLRDEAARLVEGARRRGRRLTTDRALRGIQSDRTLAAKWGKAWLKYIDNFDSEEQRLAWICLQSYKPASNHDCQRWLIKLHRLGLSQAQSATRRRCGGAEGAPYGAADRSEKNYILVNGY